MIVAINYADFKYRKAQIFNSATAIDKGKVDKVIYISSRRIDDEKQLKDEMENSLFCFMPFSDDNDFYLMQNTSFPSKLL